MTEHHPNCRHFDLEGEAVKLIQGLLKGIEFWGGDEDGIHPDCWLAYCRAKIAVGQFDVIEHMNEEEIDAEIRARGDDPDEVAAKGKAIVEKAVANYRNSDA